MKFTEQFPELEEEDHISIMHLGEVFFLKELIQKHCLSKSKVREEKKEREKYWQKRMKSERRAWEFYVKEAIENCPNYEKFGRASGSAVKNHLLKELNLKVKQ